MNSEQDLDRRAGQMFKATLVEEFLNNQEKVSKKYRRKVVVKEIIYSQVLRNTLFYNICFYGCGETTYQVSRERLLKLRPKRWAVSLIKFERKQRPFRLDFILDKKYVENHYQFLVRFKDHPKGDETWVRQNMLTCGYDLSKIVVNKEQRLNAQSILCHVTPTEKYVKQ